MSWEIDDLIRTRRPEVEADGLDTLETEVWRRVAMAHQRAASLRQTTSALVIALMIGLVGGGVVSANRPVTSSDLHVLTVEAGLEPFGLARDVG